MKDRSRSSFGTEVKLVYKKLEEYGEEVAQTFINMVLAIEELENYKEEPRSLDPIIPSFFRLVDAWGQQLKDRFEIHTDEKGALANDEEIVKAVSDPRLAEHVINYYGQICEYPLKADTMTPVDSKSSLPTQLADVFAGLIAEVLHQPNVQGSPVLEKMRGIAFEKRIVIGGLAPSPDVTPQALGKDGTMSENPIDHFARSLTKMSLLPPLPHSR